MIALVLFGGCSRKPESPQSTPLNGHIVGASANYQRPFLSYLETVEETLTDKAICKEMKQLSELSPERSAFLSDFWWVRAVSAKSRELDQIGKAYEKELEATNARLMGDKDGSIAAREMKEKTDLLMISYFYDNIEQIDATIRLNLRKASDERR